MPVFELYYEFCLVKPGSNDVDERSCRWWSTFSAMMVAKLPCEGQGGVGDLGLHVARQVGV